MKILATIALIIVSFIAYEYYFLLLRIGNEYASAHHIIFCGDYGNWKPAECFNK